MHTHRYYLQLLGLSLLVFASTTSALAQRQSSKASPAAVAQTHSNIAQLSLEEQGAAMAFGQDGMLYVLTSYGGRYRKGTLSKLNPEAFSHLQSGKGGRNHALPEDLTEVYAFGRPGETLPGGQKAELNNGPRTIIAGPDGELYISADDHFCARFDPATQALEWMKLGPGMEEFRSRDPGYSMSRDPDYSFMDAQGDCIAVTQDGLLWCKAGGQGRAGRVFHTRGGRKDLGAILGTEQWKYASLAADGYFYGATDDALIRVKSDGSDITVLHAFIGKDDHPVGAPILIGNTLFGCVHDEVKGSRSGYIYKLNPDGTGYSTVVKLDYDPAPRFESLQPLIPYGNSLYGLAPAGLFTLDVDQPTPKVIVPTKEETHPAAIVLQDGAAYILGRGRNQSDALILRMPIPQTSPTAASSPAAQTGRGSAPIGATASTRAPLSTSASATSAAPVLGGKSVFHKRQSTNDSQGVEETSAGSSPTVADEGMSAKTRPGLPPRQSRAPAQVAASSPSADSESSFSPTDQPSTSGGSSSPSAQQPLSGSSAGANQKSVFHKRQSTGDTEGTAPSADGSSSIPGDEGMPEQSRPGLPPRQSRAPAKVAPSSPSADSENSFSSAEQPSSFSSRDAEGNVEEIGSSDAPPRSRDASKDSSSNRALNFSTSSNNPDASGIAEKLVQAFSAGDVETFDSLYADTVDYYESDRISRAAVRSQLEEYFNKWPVRQWEIAGPVKVETLGGSVQRVVFSARYDLSNPDTNRHTAGTAKETLVIAADTSGAMKIISHHEKISSSNRSDSTPSKRRERQSEREKVYDGRPVIPLPPNIPWPPGIPHP